MRCCPFGQRKPEKWDVVLKIKLEKVQHRAIHVAFLILGDLVGIYKAKEVNDYVFKELWFVWNWELP